MNERIREIAQKAGLLPKEIGPVVETFHMKKKQQDLEKFAELIVRECANITLDYKNHDHYMGWVDHGEEITRHFGVER